MKSYDYQLVNVFAESHFDGNPLAVFSEADDLTDEHMQLIARQFNLSETVFFQTATEKRAVKKLRIFTPAYEMPFAGHPTVGSAFVLRKLFNLTHRYTLQTQAGLVEIRHQDEVITFALKNGVKTEPCRLSRAQCAQLLSLNESQILHTGWINTGANQLLIRVDSANAVKNCKISTALFLEHLHNHSVYVWFAQNNRAKVRLFFDSNGVEAEDPGTGSAAANLGGWAITNGLSPINWAITQGDEIRRPNRLSLRTDENQTIYVGGKVIQVGQGTFFVP